ncbi:MAG: ABC-type antimicrobial peptide transport system, permease component [Chloroflexi bacterium AL-W]|nr:ABC-type antimicrobial peptide transport system, permease component [Chloroflexi bacterium AL-N1]NOK69096.1 ABC-type antimicrobial peptide transport system, permease component [Chloroflexi bacterium AL-N10]NOK77079.1 ABC-type antimicrobial peptide transport system, permease component [Chloroflexi bacterium AL-N5]NOK83724.1 ABC-type antimicrobial peptide transport system, permease component [Chloroflexi bacterium AL-W]NOK90934.1 ABC-type antimicrobial peptide transport system, permease compon
MNVIEASRIAWLSLLSNKLRSLLTMLGIIIGIGSVIGLLSIGTGFQNFITDQFASFGVGVFYVGPFVDSRNVNETLSAQLTAADAEAIMQSENAPSVKAVSVALIDSKTVRAGGERFSYSISAVSQPHFAISGSEVEDGRFFTEAENVDAARVAVIGDRVAEELYGGTVGVIGQRLTIEGMGFEVIGLLAADQSGSGIFGDPREGVFIPYETGKTRLFRDVVSPRVDVSLMSVQAQERDLSDQAIREVTTILREQHRLTYQDNDFSIISLDQIQETVSTIFNGFSAFIAAVGGISLLVGGIGIMNIMLVNVTERTREIGLRKAVGARQHDILIQFLVEAVVLCIVGCMIGIGLGYLLSFLGTFVLVNLFEAEGAAASVTMGALTLSTVISVAIGVSFGFFPALQASRLNPIEALRSE